jgi:ribonuclease E
MSDTSPLATPADDRPERPAAEPAAASAASPPSEAPSPDGAAPGAAGGSTGAKKRRRGSRGGRSRGRTGGGGGEGGNGGNAGNGARTAGDESDRRPDDMPDRPIEGRPSPTAAAAATVMPGEPGIFPGAAPKPFLTPKVPPPVPAVEAKPAAKEVDAPKEGGAKKRRRRGGRGRSSATKRQEAAAGTLAHDVLDDEPVELDEETLEKRRGRERKGRPVGRYQMCVHVRPHATQIAVLEGRSLIEHYVSRPQDAVNQIDGNIYIGRVQNVLPGMEAAFVDIGTPKNAVLYRGDVHYDRDDVEGGGGGKSTARIEQLLRAGQTILCQVTKNPIGTKGARLTQEVSLPGRFVVFIPNSDTYGISKRLADDERKRLRRILDDVRPEGHGLIVRTAAEGATPDELRRDVARLLRQWTDIDAKAKKTKGPGLLYREPDMAVRVIREEFSRDYRAVVIDDRALYEDVHEYVASISPELADRVEFFDPEAEPLPLFERMHIHEQIHKALDRKVWLPSGGSLIIERTEALTVIDVNTGKNVGTSNLEETVYRNNLEAAEEVARQLRLRDIGGIIVIDFIDMEIRKNRDEVIKAFRNALSRDKTRTQVFDISELGLVEMTRKRVSEGLVESFSQTCPTCTGRGIVFDDSLL